ncbi:unnamed protein product [Somion occarium]|uniref:Transmembrane protein n=1 Tax=Somion occarium TaxID=3059160 RepID=A0ABP1DTN4_9APHY
MAFRPHTHARTLFSLHTFLILTVLALPHITISSPLTSPPNIPNNQIQVPFNLVPTTHIDSPTTPLPSVDDIHSTSHVPMPVGGNEGHHRGSEVMTDVPRSRYGIVDLSAHIPVGFLLN